MSIQIVQVPDVAGIGSKLLHEVGVRGRVKFFERLEHSTL